MYNFLKRLIFFFFQVIILLFTIFYLNNKNFRIDKDKFHDDEFFKKVDSFENFYKSKSSINLLLGSSVVQNINPDVFGKNWFTFCNGSQNIYQSYKFLNHYKDSTKIDTILLSLNPFDFPFSYTKNRSGARPMLNRNFHIFGKDSITSIRKLTNFKILKIIKSENYPRLENILLSVFKKNEVKTMNHVTEKVYHGNGFVTRPTPKGIDLDSLNNVKGMRAFKKAGHYFYNVLDRPNLKYFNLFDELAKSLNVKVIYLLTPKSKYYHLKMEKENQNVKLKNLLSMLKQENIEIWNYENVNIEDKNFNSFYDDTHLSLEATREFVKIIKKRLKNSF